MMLLCILILLALCGSAQASACGETCGLRPMLNTYGGSRVVGGTDVLQGTGAWAGIASICTIWKPPVVAHICGGTLITPQWVLTAAHCFPNISIPISEWSIVLGATSWTQTEPEVQVRRIKRVIIHEDFTPTLLHDIALVELDRPVQCSNTLQLACLPHPTVKVTEVTNCYVAGWGDRIVKSSGDIAILQQAKVHYVDLKICNSTDWLNGNVYDFQVCAGQAGISTCQGDSGGPLVCHDSQRDIYWQIGITSWAVGCARPKRPTVYTSTQYYYNWIENMIAGNAAVTAAPAPTAPNPVEPCPFPKEKLKQFFNLLKELLQFLSGKIF